jgi:hypothetical protein
MSKISLAIFFLCLPVLTFAQASASASRYQPAIITQVKPHQSGGSSAPDEAVYEVAVKVNGTTYVVLTKSPSGESTILYAIGRELLVKVGGSTITWNDIMGQSHEVPIMSRGPIADSSKSPTD